MGRSAYPIRRRRCWRLRWSEPEAAERGIPRLRRTHPSHAAQARLCPFVRAHARKLRSNERQCVLVRLPLTVDTPSVPRGHHEGGVGGAGHAGSPASPPPHRCRRRCRRGCCPTRRSRPPPCSSDRTARRAAIGAHVRHDEAAAFSSQCGGADPRPAPAPTVRLLVAPERLLPDCLADDRCRTDALRARLWLSVAAAACWRANSRLPATRTTPIQTQ